MPSTDNRDNSQQTILACIVRHGTLCRFTSQTRLARGASLRVSIGDIADLLELSPREIEELRKLHNDPKPKEVQDYNHVLPVQDGRVVAFCDMDDCGGAVSWPLLHDVGLAFAPLAAA